MATHSTFIVGIASIIPGLGFWLLGQRRFAVILGSIIIGLFAVSVLFFGKPIGQFAAQLFLLSWPAQSVVSIHTALFNKRLQKGEIQAAQPMTGFRKSKVKVPITNASEYVSREIAKSQLQGEERIIKTLIAKQHISSGMSFLLGPAAYFSSSWYNITLTQSNLLLIELTNNWKPLGIIRIPLSEKIQIRYKQGLLNYDMLNINYDQGKELNLYVSRSDRKQAQAIISVFNKA